MHSSHTSFYITDGTLSRDAACYVARSADTRLLDGLRSGQFCYVLTARQMGKSSLMVRTACSLQAEGASVVTIDLTSIGQDLNSEQWYRGLMDRIGRQLDLEEELERFWNSHPHAAPVARLFGGLEQVVLDGCKGPVVLFIDEIDMVRTLPFSTDEFFAAIRAWYNRRANSPGLARLTFCLLGVAAPTDLIHDPRMTPFNIGRRIQLEDFTEAEAALLAGGLGEKGPLLLRRILTWTGGHPFLTQRLCQAAAERRKGTRARDVDTLCEEMFFSPRAQEIDDNLLFVRESLLRTETDPIALLTLYGRVRSGKRVQHETFEQRTTTLLLCGIVRSASGRLQVRNRIYARVFDRAWVDAHMPGAELRRQRAAYRRGVLRASAYASVALCVLAFLAVTAAREAREAQTARSRALRAADDLRAALHDRDREAAYAQREAALALRHLKLANRNARRAAESAAHARASSAAAQAVRNTALARSRESANRLSGMLVSNGTRAMDQGDQFGALLWYIQAAKSDMEYAANRRVHELRIGSTQRHAPRLERMWFGVRSARLSGDGNRIVIASADGCARVYDVATGAAAGPPLRQGADLRMAALSPDGRVALTTGGRLARLWDTKTGTPKTGLLRYDDAIVDAAFAPDGTCVCIAARDRCDILDLRTGRPLIAPFRDTNDVRVTFSPEGRRLLVYRRDAAAFYLWNGVVGSAWKYLRCRDSFFPSHCALPPTPDSSAAAVGCSNGQLMLWDVEKGELRIAHYLHRASINCVAYSPDGERLATASDDGTAILSNVQTGESLTPPLRHTSAVVSVCFSRDGRRIVTASGDRAQDPAVSRILNTGGVARIWDARNGEPTGLALRHTSAVVHAAWSPDGRLMATCSDDNTARVWDAETGEPITPPLHHGHAVQKAIFSPDGQSLLTVCFDGVGRVWNLSRVSPQRAAASAAALAARRPGGGDLLLLSAPAMEAAWRARPPGRPSLQGAPLLAWHLQEAAADMDAGAWSRALGHLDRLLEARPWDRQVRLLRVQAYAELRRWDRVARDQALLGIVGARIVILAAYEHVRRTCPGDSPLQIGAQSYTDGLSSMAKYQLLVLLPGPAARFTAVAGVDPRRSDDGARFSVRVAGKEEFRTDLLKPGQAGVSVSVPLQGASAFEIEVKHSRLDMQADWAQARVVMANGQVIKLSDLPIAAANEL
jgi:WD40 repeat protein